MSGPAVRLVAGHPTDRTVATVYLNPRQVVALIPGPESELEDAYVDCSDGARYRLELTFKEARRWVEYGTP